MRHALGARGRPTPTLSTQAVERRAPALIREVAALGEQQERAALSQLRDNLLDPRLGALSIGGVDHRLRKPVGQDVHAWIDRDALLEHDAGAAAKARHQLIDDEDRVAGSRVTAQDDDRSVRLERATGVRGELGVNVDLERLAPRGGEPADEPAEQPPVEKLDASGSDQAARAGGHPERSAHEQRGELAAEVGKRQSRHDQRLPAAGQRLGEHAECEQQGGESQAGRATRSETATVTGRRRAVGGIRPPTGSAAMPRRPSRSVARWCAWLARPATAQ